METLQGDNDTFWGVLSDVDELINSVKIVFRKLKTFQVNIIKNMDTWFLGMWHWYGKMILCSDFKHVCLE